MKQGRLVCLIGNPNSGKSTLFNRLTGLNQKTSNFPGITVEKKVGRLQSADHFVNIMDLPGTYSLFPNSSDEKLVVSTLLNRKGKNFPDLAVFVCSIHQIETHLLLASQIIDLGIPTLIALNMSDEYEGDSDVLCRNVSSVFGVTTLALSSKTGHGVSQLIRLIDADDYTQYRPTGSVYALPEKGRASLEKIQKALELDNAYTAKLTAHHATWLPHLTADERSMVENENQSSGFEDLRGQVEETFARLDHIRDSVVRVQRAEKQLKFTGAVDRIITHTFLGPIIFLALLTLIFQSVFSWSEWPMEAIEHLFAITGQWVEGALPDSWPTSLLVDGILAGLGGIMVFIPQIAFLFFFISLLEESGYMSRAVYMLDPLMQKFGMNGRSVVALVSSGACAIPAIMSTRTIANWKERFITIMVSPLISCSARIPVYALLVSFVIPQGRIGLFNYQGLAFMGLYLLGIAAALATAVLLRIFIKNDGSSALLMELPLYKRPVFSNVFYTVKEKVSAFIVEAGKVIIAISIVLWFLVSYGPGDGSDATAGTGGTATEAAASVALENSYAGHFGKWIEPAITPLGFDWKIGISLLTSFAAREVFVGSMATIYSVGDEENTKGLRDKMLAEYKPGGFEKRYNLATSLSLLIFYVFALQCMSTLAVTRKETNSWKWPIVQFVYMGGLAYVGSLLTYQLLS